MSDSSEGGKCVCGSSHFHHPSMSGIAAKGRGKLPSALLGQEGENQEASASAWNFPIPVWHPPLGMIYSSGWRNTLCYSSSAPDRHRANLQIHTRGEATFPRCDSNSVWQSASLLPRLRKYLVTCTSEQKGTLA